MKQEINDCTIWSLYFAKDIQQNLMYVVNIGEVLINSYVRLCHRRTRVKIINDDISHKQHQS